MKSFWDIIDFREISVFNSREIAFFILGLIFVSYSILNKNIRQHILGLTKTLFSKSLVITYLLVIIYSSVPLLVLYKLGYWRIELVKDAIFWLVFSALPVLFDINKANKEFFKKAFFDNLKFSVVIDFITSQHTFNVVVEIGIVLASLFLGGLIAFSSREEKYKTVNKIFTTIATMIGSYILLSSAYFIVFNLNKVFTPDKIQEFSLPIILGLWFVPFLYFMHVYMIYESVLSTLKYSIEDDDIRKFAQIKSVLNYKFDLSSLKRWKQHVLNKSLSSKEEVLISFLDIKRQQLIEKNPPKVDPAKGWSPYEAKNYLNDFGITTGYYREYFDNDWGASSPYVKLNDEILNNNIAYYLAGDSTTVKKLKVNLTIYPSAEEEYALNKFVECISYLYNVTFREPIPTSIIKSINNKQKKNIQKKNIQNTNKELFIRREDHVGTVEGYSLYFTLSQE